MVLKPLHSQSLSETCLQPFGPQPCPTCCNTRCSKHYDQPQARTVHGIIYTQCEDIWAATHALLPSTQQQNVAVAHTVRRMHFDLGVHGGGELSHCRYPCSLTHTHTHTRTQPPTHTCDHAWVYPVLLPSKPPVASRLHSASSLSTPRCAPTPTKLLAAIMPLAAAAGTPIPAQHTVHTAVSYHVCQPAQAALSHPCVQCTCGDGALRANSMSGDRRGQCSPGMQLSPHTVKPGTGVELPGQPAPLAAEIAGPGDIHRGQKRAESTHETQVSVLSSDQFVQHALQRAGLLA